MPCKISCVWASSSCVDRAGIELTISLDHFFSDIHRVIHTICPEWPACHPQVGGWQATRLVSRVKWLWRHRLTRRNGNVVLENVVLEKYIFWTYGRKIIKLYCPLVTAKSTNPCVKWTCPCLGKLGHEQVYLTLGLVDFAVTNGQ